MSIDEDKPPAKNQYKSNPWLIAAVAVMAVITAVSLLTRNSSTAAASAGSTPTAAAAAERPTTTTTIPPTTTTTVAPFDPANYVIPSDRDWTLWMRDFREHRGDRLALFASVYDIEGRTLHAVARPSNSDFGFMGMDGEFIEIVVPEDVMPDNLIENDEIKFWGTAVGENVSESIWFEETGAPRFEVDHMVIVEFADGIPNPDLVWPESPD